MKNRRDQSVPPGRVHPILWSDKPGVKGFIGMHRFNICLVVVLLWCENTITAL